MLKRIIKSLILIQFIFTGCIAFADDIGVEVQDYDSRAYSDQSTLFVKAKAYGAFIDAQQTSLPNYQQIEHPLSTARDTILYYGMLELSGTLFFSSNLALELMAGVGGYALDISIIDVIVNNYGITPKTDDSLKSTFMYAVPLAATMQYHIAPYGPISPFFGGGYSWMYLVSTYQFIPDNPRGFVLQGGINFHLKDDSMITIEIKRPFYSAVQLQYDENYFSAYTAPTVTTPNTNTNTNTNASIVSGKYPAMTSEVDINRLYFAISYGFEF